MAVIGVKIRKVRELRNITQEYMAEKMGVSQSSYSRYENGEQKVTPDLLSDIASILNVKKEFIESFDENVYFNNHSNSVSDQAKANLLGNYCATVNQYMLDEKLENLYQKTIDLLEEKIASLQKELDKK